MDFLRIESVRYKGRVPAKGAGSINFFIRARKFQILSGGQCVLDVMKSDRFGERDLPGCEVFGRLLFDGLKGGGDVFAFALRELV